MKNIKSTDQSIWRIVCRLIRMGMPMWALSIAGSMILGIASYSLYLGYGLLLRLTVDRLEIGTSPLKPLLFTTAFFLLIAIAMGIGYILNLIGAMKSRGEVQIKAVYKYLYATEEEVQKHHSGDMMSRMTNDMNRIEDFYFQGLLINVTIPAIQGIAAIITIAYVDIRLVAVAIVSGSVSALAPLTFTKKIQAASKSSRTKMGELTTMFIELVSGNSAIRMHDMQKSIIERYKSVNGDYVSIESKARKTEYKAAFLTQAFQVASVTAFLVTGMYLSIVGNINFSNLLLVLPMQELVNQMLASFGLMFNYIASVSASAERVIEILDMKCNDSKENFQEFAFEDNEDNTADLEFNDVSFSYEEGEKALNNVSFSLKPGTITALVGPSGSGKSTIFKLMLLLWPISDGDICMNKSSFREFSVSSWRSKFAYLQQEAPLLDISIYENIAIGIYGRKPTADQSEIEFFAKAAGAHEFIMSLPNGYNTIVGELGSTLSGGQRQRISIARALASEAPFVLLDEPTAALDAESEHLIQKSLEKLINSRTVLMTTHRLSTIRNVDQIIVLDKGTIVESGTHDELVKRNGLYYKLLSSQKNDI